MPRQIELIIIKGSPFMRKIGYIVLLVIFAGCSSEQQDQQQNAQNQMQMQQTQRQVELDWKAPAEWVKEQPSSNMRVAQYKLPGPGDAAAAELAVFNFPGTGGTVEMNLERWYGQFQQPDGSVTQELAEKQILSVNGMPSTIVYVTGTYLEAQSGMMMDGPVTERENYAMLAAIVETGASPWFFKATGPAETIDAWRDEFTAFVKTIQK